VEIIQDVRISEFFRSTKKGAGGKKEKYKNAAEHELSSAAEKN
jgi:hypothetical protein